MNVATRSRKPAVPCDHCINESVGRCCWPVERKTAIRAEELRVGDIFITPTTRNQFYVVHIERSRTFLTITISRRSSPEYQYHYAFDFMVTAIRPGRCDRPCCDFHVRELGDGVYHCMDHWNAWEGVFPAETLEAART